MKLINSTKLKRKIGLLTITAVLLSPTTKAEIDEKTIQTNHLVKAGDKYITLLGQQINIGEKAPEFKVVDENFKPVQLSDFKEKTLLISVVPSLDTGICSLQTKRFNEEVAQLSKDITILTISNDLPFAQKRFCKSENINNLQVLSDNVWREFGYHYGLLIKDMGLLTRAIFIIDEQRTVVYKELVDNISNHPNYELALSTLTAVTTRINPVEINSIETTNSSENTKETTLDLAPPASLKK